MRKIRKNLKKSKPIVPPSIKLLFENERLEMIKTLCLLYAYYLSSKKKFNKISDIVFYYSIVNYDLIKIIETSGERNNDVSPNLYLRFQTKINKILLELSFLNYIEIKGDLTYKTKDLGVRLTNKGVEFLLKMESEYFSKLIEEYISVLTKIGNTSENRSKLEGGVQ